MDKWWETLQINQLINLSYEKFIRDDDYVVSDEKWWPRGLNEMFPFDTIQFVVTLILLAKIVRTLRPPHGQIPDEQEWQPPEY